MKADGKYRVKRRIEPIFSLSTHCFAATILVVFAGVVTPLWAAEYNGVYSAHVAGDFTVSGYMKVEQTGSAVTIRFDWDVEDYAGTESAATVSASSSKTDLSLTFAPDGISYSGTWQAGQAGGTIQGNKVDDSLWSVAEEHFATVCERSDEQELASRALTQSAPPTRAPDEHKVRYLPCVVCKDLMSRRNYSGRSGIIIDVCREHGIWLDHTELEGILSFIRGGGLDRAREAQLERLKRQEQWTRASRHTSAVEYAAPFSQRRPARRGLTLGNWVEWALDGLL